MTKDQCTMTEKQSSCKTIVVSLKFYYPKGNSFMNMSRLLYERGSIMMFWFCAGKGVRNYIGLDPEFYSSGDSI